MTFAIIALTIVAGFSLVARYYLGRRDSCPERANQNVDIDTSGASEKDSTNRVKVEVCQIHFDLATDPNNPSLQLAFRLCNPNAQELVIEKINWEVVADVQKKFTMRGVYSKPILLLAQQSLDHLFIREAVNYLEARYVAQTKEGLTFNCYADGTIIGKTGGEAFQDRFLCLNVPCLVGEHTSIIAQSLLIEPVHLDPLTGLLNRKFLSDYFQPIMDSLESEQQLSFVIFDIDDFKKVNDEQGHLIGDNAIKLVAEKMREAIGSRGFSIRYAGDEFCTILKGCSIEESKILAEHVRALVSGYKFRVSGGKLKLTLSAGIATTSKKISYLSLIQKADDMLRVSKQSGKDRTSESLAT